jgi:S-disulfanyl-L-cysteine oxidoreductase SoxD
MTKVIALIYPLLVLTLALPTGAKAQTEPSALPAPAAPISVATGVYTEEQAKRGQGIVETVCSTCHQPSWFGGPEWKEHWGFGEVFWVYDFVRTYMPYGRPGSLSANEYRSVVAYMLKNAGFKAGTTELPRTDAELMQIVFPTP